MDMTTIKKLNTFTLTLLITSAIDSVRNLPASALLGSTLIFFFIFAAIVFLIPTALVSAELSANINEGGIYQWCRLAMGERLAFLAIWLQWTANLVWFPTILSFIAGTAAYLIDPALAQNKIYLVSSILIVFWSLTLLNLKGIRVSARFTSVCAIIGFVIPMAFIIILMLIWVALGKPLQIHLNNHTLFPDLGHMNNWIALIAIMVGFSGMELASVHLKDVNEPKKTFPRALLFSTIIILTTMILGSLAVAFVLPYKDINLINGTIQTFAYFLSAFHLSWLTPILTLLLVIGSLGGIISWVISPPKGVAQAAEHHFLPAILKRVNKYSAPQNMLLFQAIIVSLFCAAFILLPGVNVAFIFLTAMSSQLYTLMYAMMFMAALRLRYTAHYSPHTFKIPGGKMGTSLVCIVGLLGCAMTFFIGFIPQVNSGFSKILYESIFCATLVGAILPVLFFYAYRMFHVHNAVSPITATPIVNDKNSHIPCDSPRCS